MSKGNVHQAFMIKWTGLLMTICLLFDITEHAEADTFFCFTNLMSKMRDNFIKTLDDSPTGINAKMNRLMQMVKRCDAKLWVRFQQQDLKPQFFGFRWLTLWLTQEFPLPGNQDLLSVYRWPLSTRLKCASLIPPLDSFVVILKLQSMFFFFLCFEWK